MSPDYLENPWPLYAQYRRERPVWWSEEIRMFCVFRYEHVRTVLKDPRFTVDYPFRVTEQLFGRTLIDMEGPEHVRLRQRLAPLFGAANLAAFAREVSEPQIAELIRLATDRSPLEFMQAVAERVPTLMISAFLGLPASGEQWLFQRMMTLMDHLDGKTDKRREVSIAHRELSAWLDEHIARLQREPAGGLGYKRLIDGIGDESPETIKGLHWGLLAGGIETSMCFLGNAVAVLTAHPEWFARLADPSSPMARSILEEVLRFEPVQAATVRFAAEDVELGGVSIRKGQAINVLLASAARDESVFASPDVFDPTRPLGKSLSFAIGPHACIGKHFTMMNAEITLRALWSTWRGVRRANSVGATIRGASFRRPQSLFLERSNNPSVRDLVSAPTGTMQ
ncbi:hypothetical protein BE20_36950 [Sorangium cellulosum]|uniref:Cytochrome P450 n=1 Tax=Sorangium cellulosum TaxID=56 RepID=A0A150SF94_SORCE|nr:hypothetical protein BE18_04600 [Sorangium cellulosum]KYF97899.1 hypothetical protein BE20_36950 [Sorangium cellulosum]